MNEQDKDRIEHPSMEFYREVYKDSPWWGGGSLRGMVDLNLDIQVDCRTLIVYCEQGFGDIIQFSRYIKDIQGADDNFSLQQLAGPVGRIGKVLIACPKELHRIFGRSFYPHRCIDKQNPILPPHDCHVLSMSMPDVMKIKHSHGPKYLWEDQNNKEDLSEFEGLKIGIAWESKGNPAKSIPFDFFAKMGERLNANLFMIQDKIHDPGLIGRHADLYSSEIGDFADTANLIASVDVVVSVDTAVLHLAGAMGKKTWGLISTDATDGRFNRCKPLEVGFQPIWYPTMRILFREPSSNWTDVFRTLTNELRKI